MSALILSECVYKLVDIGEQESAKAASHFTAQFPPGLVSLQHIQSANTTVPHRCIASKSEIAGVSASGAIVCAEANLNYSPLKC